MPGMGGGGADNAMMLEIQLKMARRAEKAAEAGGSGRSDTVKAQQRQLLEKSSSRSGRESSEEGGSLVEDLASGAASGVLFAQRRALARQMAEGAASKTPPGLQGARL